MSNRMTCRLPSLLGRLMTTLAVFVSISVLSTVSAEPAAKSRWQGVAQRLSRERHDYSLIQDPSAVLAGGAKQLSDINILLPLQSCPDCRRAHKLVSAINGCYQW